MTATPSSADSVKGSSDENPKSLHAQDNPNPGVELTLAAVREVVRTELREEALRMGAFAAPPLEAQPLVVDLPQKPSWHRPNAQRQHERQFSKGGGDETWL